MHLSVNMLIGKFAGFAFIIRTVRMPGILIAAAFDHARIIFSDATEAECIFRAIVYALAAGHAVGVIEAAESAAADDGVRIALFAANPAAGAFIIAQPKSRCAGYSRHKSIEQPHRTRRPAEWPVYKYRRKHQKSQQYPADGIDRNKIKRHFERIDFYE